MYDDRRAEALWYMTECKKKRVTVVAESGGRGKGKAKRDFNFQVRA